MEEGDRLLRAEENSLSTEETNAARASHPSRIVIADVLTAVFRRGERSSRIRTPKSALQRRPLRLALQVRTLAFPSLLEEGLLRRPLSPGTGALDMRRISPSDSLSKITGNAEPWSEQIQNITRF